MNPTLAVLLTGIVLFPSLAPQDPQAAPKFGPEALKKMEWLCGTWVLQDGKRTTEEHWRPLRGTTILGCSHSYDDEKTTFFEHLRITAMKGTIAYVAMPGGATPTAFLLTKLEDGAMVFENGKHDAPQRIRYEQTKSGMTATICQLDGSKLQSFVFKKKD